MSNLPNIAWAAGFLDAEGCFSGRRLSPGGSGKISMLPQFGMSQKDRFVLDRFRGIVGVGKVYGPYYNKWGEYFNYISQDWADVQRIASMLWFFLSPAKRYQAYLSLKGYRQQLLGSFRVPRKSPLGRPIISIPNAIRTESSFESDDSGWNRHCALAWAAGFYDGEGSLKSKVSGRTASGENRIHPKLSVGQKNRYLLDRFRRVMGVGKVRGPYREKRIVHYYDVEKWEEYQYVVASMWLFLSPVKRDQAYSVLGRYRTQVSKSVRKPYRAQGYTSR